MNNLEEIGRSGGQAHQAMTIKKTLRLAVFVSDKEVLYVVVHRIVSPDYKDYELQFATTYIMQQYQIASKLPIYASQRGFF